MPDEPNNPIVPDEPPTSGGSVSSDLVERWLDTQNRQMEAQAHATELQRQQDNNAFEFGKLALAAQERDRIHERESGRKTQRERLVFSLAIIAVLAAIVIVAICLNKDQVAMELIKAVLYVAAGAAGGYGYAKTRTTKRDSDPQQDANS